MNAHVKMSRKYVAKRALLKLNKNFEYSRAYELILIEYDVNAYQRFCQMTKSNDI